MSSASGSGMEKGDREGEIPASRVRAGDARTGMRLGRAELPTSRLSELRKQRALELSGTGRARALVPVEECLDLAELFIRSANGDHPRHMIGRYDDGVLRQGQEGTHQVGRLADRKAAKQKGLLG